MNYKVRVVREAKGPKGEIVPVGTEIVSPTCWRLCLTQFQNTAPWAEPADDVTAAKVTAERTKQNANIEAEKERLAARVARIKVDETGRSKARTKAVRDAENHLLDQARAYGVAVPGGADAAAEDASE